VAQAYIDIVHEEEEKTARNQRKRARQKQKKKKPRRSVKAAARPSRTPGSAAGGTKLAVIDGGANSGDTNEQPESVEEEA